jgi:hypothetical protein
MFAIFSSHAFANTASFNGSFSQDDQHFLASFTLFAPGTVTLETWSYAGGDDPASGRTAAGGFAPVLSVFDASGNIVGNFDDGGSPPSDCGPRGIDPVSGFCLDAYLQDSLSAGMYFVVLTEYDNTPAGATLADGFAEDGNGDFTGPNVVGVPGSFIDPGGYQRTPNYDFSITGADEASAIPEPSMTLYVGSGLLCCAMFQAMRKRPGMGKGNL